MLAVYLFDVALNADYRVNPCSGQPAKLTASSGTIRSPGFSSRRYPNNAYCQWIVEAPAGYVRP